eukprot:scaffold296646_cov33-Tisochrysis_lutea.AAC.3
MLSVNEAMPVSTRIHALGHFREGSTRWQRTRHTCPATKSCSCCNLVSPKSKGEKEPPHSVMICGARLKKEGGGEPKFSGKRVRGEAWPLGDCPPSSAETRD